MKSIVYMLLITLILCFPSWLLGATRLMYEDFDDQQVDSGLIIYGGGWSLLSPPQYNLDQVGRNGQGFSFSSGTVSEANISWEKNVPSPWPSDELYFSMWMRYPSFTSTDSMENFKIFYPHWNGVNSYVHFSMSSDDIVYYSSKGNGTTLSASNWISCVNQTDGNWHHYEWWIKFSTAQVRFWYDNALVLDHDYQDGVWTPNNVYYIWAPSIDAEEEGTFSRQVDDWEVWDGVPDSDPGVLSSPVDFNPVDS